MIGASQGGEGKGRREGRTHHRAPGRDRDLRRSAGDEGQRLTILELCHHGPGSVVATDESYQPAVVQRKTQVGIVRRCARLQRRILRSQGL
jgi:hypothetical protein